MTFIDGLFLFPTVLFTFGLGLASVYWLLVIGGAVGLEAFDFDMDFDVDAGVDGALDGAADAADGAIEGGHHWMWFLVEALALRKAPVTVVFSLFVLWGWVASMLGTHALTTVLGRPPGIALGAALLLGVLAIAALLTNRSVQPLAHIFETHEAAKRTDALGAQCEIRTGRVDASFGQAEIQDGGAGLLVEVRCEQPNTLKRGDAALVVDYDPEGEAYIIEPMHAVLAESDDTADADQAADAEAFEAFDAALSEQTNKQSS